MFIAGKPSGHLVASLCCNVRAIGVSAEFDVSVAGRFGARIEDAVAQARTVWLAAPPGEQGAALPVLSGYRLRLTGQCEALRLVPEGSTLCAVVR